MDTDTVYSVAIERSFVAQHYLTVPDCGRENEVHSHTYTAEIEAKGSSLGEHNYLIDIVEFEGIVEGVIEMYRDETLNGLPRFGGNPSAEQFARVLGECIGERLSDSGVDSVVVRMKEDERARVSYERSIDNQAEQ